MRRQPLLERIKQRVEPELFTPRVDSYCWTWKGAKASSGYGLIQAGRVSPSGYRMPSYVHRVVYELLVGPIPGDKEIDHICRNRACCNPEHLQAVTHASNVRLGVSIAADYAVRDECGRGHPKTPENTYVRPDGKGHCCLACARMRGRRGHRAANEARKAALAEAI